MLGLSGGTVLQKRWVGVADPRVAVAVQSAVGTAILAPAALLTGGHVDVSVEFGLCVGWLAWGMGIGTLLVFVHLLRGFSASAVAALLLVVPAVTAIASAPVARRGAAPREPRRDVRGDGRDLRGSRCGDAHPHAAAPTDPPSVQAALASRAGTSAGSLMIVELGPITAATTSSIPRAAARVNAMRRAVATSSARMFSCHGAKVL